jgi:hypothetical protein
MRFGFAVVTFAILGCSGNAVDEQRVCTLIGCEDGLNVQVNNSVNQSVSVNVRSGTHVIGSFACTAGQPCAAFIRNQTPANVTIEVTSQAGTVSRNYSPEYRTTRPNGPDCPPECRQAVVTVTVN